MYKTIAIPIAFDQDKDIAGAVELARRIAAEGATLTFLHAIEIPQPYIATYIPPAVIETGRAEMLEKLAALAEEFPGVETQLMIGPAGRSITTWAEDHGADCIVIASHRPALSDILLGSTAAWVVRHAQCAVHVLR